VVEVSTSKTGKHGHAKCHFVALDIFTNRKMEELVPSSHNLEVWRRRRPSPFSPSSPRRPPGDCAAASPHRQGCLSAGVPGAEG